MVLTLCEKFISYLVTFFTGSSVKKTLLIEDGCSCSSSTISSSSSLDNEINFLADQIQKQITIDTTIVATNVTTKYGRRRRHEKDRSKFHHQYTPYFEDWNGEENSLYRLETTKRMSLTSLSSYDLFFLDVAFSYYLEEIDDDDDSNFNDDFLVLVSPLFHTCWTNRC
ncbi:4569_t:CDS:2 [Ambispora leptoticha]|uniref:4569_t:CDS:1 n=1 Tax=Ambispora leptoticha TaxID=144679 RepID=A0A9N8WKZ6_9GLOM|nr:4569_t:CDS:2 [Ambispora leptoticha]